MDMMKLMRQAQNLQKQITEAQKTYAALNIEGDAGNGAVKVICDGRGFFKSIKLSAEALNPDNPSEVSTDTIEMLEDLITTAIKSTSEKAQAELEGHMKRVTKELNIPLPPGMI